MFNAQTIDYSILIVISKDLHLKKIRNTLRLLTYTNGRSKISLPFILKLLFVGKGNNLYCIVGIKGTR